MLRSGVTLKGELRTDENIRLEMKILEDIVNKNNDVLGWRNINHYNGNRNKSRLQYIIHLLHPSPARETSDAIKQHESFKLLCGTPVLSQGSTVAKLNDLEIELKLVWYRLTIDNPKDLLNVGKPYRGALGLLRRRHLLPGV